MMIVRIGHPRHDGVDRLDEPVEEVRELGTLGGLELAEDVHHRRRPSSSDGIVSTGALVGDSHEHDPAVLGGGVPLDEAVGLEALDGTRRRGGIDTEASGEFLHGPVVAT